MTKNDAFFKILFAIALALLPLIVYAYHFIDSEWVLTLFVVAVFACRVWMEVFKDKISFKSQLINSIGAILTLGFILIFFACVDLVSTAFAVICIVAVILAHAIKLSLFGKNMPELIEAVDFCFIVFECLTILLLAFASKIAFVVNIAIVAVIITAVVSIAYKVFFAFKYTNLWLNIKNVFKRK